jgi:Peptidase M61 N-terminal domain
MITLLSPKWIAFAAVAMTAVAASAQDKSAPAMLLVVDETQAARRIAHVHEEIRVRPGMLALAYPRWIPGEYGPTGPVQHFAEATKITDPSGRITAAGSYPSQGRF